MSDDPVVQSAKDYLKRTGEYVKDKENRTETRSVKHIHNSQKIISDLLLLYQNYKEALKGKRRSGVSRLDDRG